MAIDTRDRRSSAIQVSMPWRGMFPLPDSSIGSGDRVHAAAYYRGLLLATTTLLDIDVTRERVTSARGIDEVLNL